MDTATEFDLVVIGGGPGGYGAALYATSAGLNVALVEMGVMGGTCLNRGCIPAKAFLETAAVHRHVAHAAEFGIESSTPVVNFATAQARKQKIVDGVVKSLTGFMKSKKITILDGVGALGPDRTVDRHRAEGATTIHRQRASCWRPARCRARFPGSNREGPIMTSDEVLMLDHVPGRVAVIGGGAIGCEFASTFADLGAQVTILEFLPKILPGLDSDVANVVVRSFKKKNIDIRTGVKVLGHTPTESGGTTVHFGDGARTSKSTPSSSASGAARSPTSWGCRAPAVKVSDRGFIEVDEYCRTGEPGVYAIGDIIDTPQLAHVGYAEAILVVKDILGESPIPGRLRPCAVGDLLRSGGGVRRTERGSRPRSRPRRRRRQAPVPGQQPGADPRRRSTASSRSSPRSKPTALPGRSSACTWSDRG